MIHGEASSLTANYRLVLSMLILWISSLCLVAASRDVVTAGAPNVAEKYLIDQVAAGKVANLATAFPNEGARVIRGVFLEELLTGSRKDCLIQSGEIRAERKS